MCVCNSHGDSLMSPILLKHFKGFFCRCWFYFASVALSRTTRRSSKSNGNENISPKLLTYARVFKSTLKMHLKPFKNYIEQHHKFVILLLQFGGVHKADDVGGRRSPVRCLRRISVRSHRKSKTGEETENFNIKNG